MLVPESSRRKNVALFKVAASDEQGISDSRESAGYYKLFAWDSVVPGAYESPEFLQKYEARGVDVKMSASGTARMDLTAIR